MPVHWAKRQTRLSGEVRRCNVHGMFIVTAHDASLGFLMDLMIEAPWGQVSCTAVPRFVGETPQGRGIGVELHVMDSGDRELWNAHHRRLSGRSVRDEG